MRTRTRTVAWTLAIAFGVSLDGPPSHAREVALSSFTIVAHPDVPVSEISADHLRDVYLGEKRSWNDRLAIRPVDQNVSSDVRREFSLLILRRPAFAVHVLWQRQIFSGGAIPPVLMNTDDEVIAYVASQPGAIGYVSSKARVTRVKVLPLIDDRSSNS